MMATKTVYLHWDPADQTTLEDSDHYPVIMKPTGVSASDLLPMSLIGCASYDIVKILEKQRQQLFSMKITAESTQDETPPWKFRKIHIHYQLRGRGLDSEKVGRAIKLSEENYCAVYATLRDVVEITHDFEIMEV
jgi:putative redox protein